MRFRRERPFAASAAHFHASGLPTILIVTHSWGGGTERHVNDLVDAVDGLVNVISLHIVDGVIELRIPKSLGHSVLRLADNQYDVLRNVLYSFRLIRVHIHQLLGREALLRSIIVDLAIPFDMTIHDYYIVCPQIHLHAQTSPGYCGELGVEQCNRCIRDYNSFSADDIVDWRTSHAWFVEKASRVICPSRDVQNRIAKYYPRAKAIVVPHEAVLANSWTVKSPRLPIDGRLRVTVIGHLTSLKGRELVEACVRQGAHLKMDFTLIGATQPPFAPETAKDLFKPAPVKSRSWAII